MAAGTTPAAPSESTSQQSAKRRAACDECRTKKLKCAGEQPQCSRCVRERIPCVYGPPKQMGRPRKRLRSNEGLEIGMAIGRAGAEGRSRPRVEGGHSSGGRQDGEDESQGIVPASTAEEQSFDASSVFTPGGGLQPWLQPSSSSGRGQWVTGLPGLDAIPPAETSVPSLTPDSSSNSTPSTHLPGDIHPLPHTHNHHDASTQLLLDPSLSGLNLGLPHSSMPPCACLSTMYLTLNTLQSMPTFSFPQALHPLREAMQTASEVISCGHCPAKFISAIQNTHLLGVLLVSIAERFGKILDSIATESSRAERAHETKTLRLADLNTPTSHLHTGGLNCAAGFSVTLSPSEWRIMAKKVVKAEVYGPSDGNHCCVHFLAVTAQMQRRQESWHCAPPTQDFPRDAEGRHLGGPQIPKEDHMCLKMIAYTRKLVDAFDWS